MWIALSVLTVAHADPGLLPKGSAALYGGAGMSTWSVGMSRNPRDPAAIFRADTWAGYGLGDHVQITGGLPVVHSRILVDGPDRPCPNNEADYCRPVTSVGDAHALVHVGGRWRKAMGRLAAGPRGDAWNAGTRQRYINVGQGTWGGLLEGSAGVESVGVGTFVEGRYIVRLGRVVPGEDFRAPSDAVQGTVAVHGTFGKVRGQLAVHAHQQVAGVDYGPAYLQSLYDTGNRWGSVAFRQLRVEGKLSYSMTDRSGLHLTLSRAAMTDNGPPDHLDVALGAHLWIPPKGSR